jgi:ESCRT-I complex subunit TSG101
MDLDGLLTQVGHPNRNRVRSDVIALVRQYGSLSCRLGNHIANDGSEARLLTVEGTLPITYKGNTYNIPVELLVSATYPDAAPLCFVRPVKGMEVTYRQ